MRIAIGFDIAFDLPASVPMILMLYVRPERERDLVEPAGREIVDVGPGLTVSNYIDTFGNRCGRVFAPAGRLELRHRAVILDHAVPDPSIQGLRTLPVEALPSDVIQFLLASRYCEVDRFISIAWNLFGKTEPGWQRVQAVVDFAHQHVKFGYLYASPTKTAWDVYQEGRGVCRDYQHLAITLLRCLNIPARYVTGYLGDIGVPPDPAPMDFSAWMEVYMTDEQGRGAWRTMDARHNKPRTGRILMAVGRDATDVALTTSFGAANLASFSVVCEEVG